MSRSPRHDQLVAIQPSGLDRHLCKGHTLLHERRFAHRTDAQTSADTAATQGTPAPASRHRNKERWE